MDSTVTEDRLAQMLEHVAAGDHGAFRAFYEATVDKCFALAVAVLRSREDAEDCVSDAYMQVWRTAGDFDTSKGSALAWLATICRRRAIDRVRRARSRQSVVNDAERAEQGADGDAAWPDVGFLLESATLSKAIRRLSADEIAVLKLAFIEDYTHSEIADATGLPLGTVKTRLRRAVSFLRQELAVE